MSACFANSTCAALILTDLEVRDKPRRIFALGFRFAFHEMHRNLEVVTGDSNDCVQTAPHFAGLMPGLSWDL
jgi:hypothetical protein